MAAKKTAAKKTAAPSSRAKAQTCAYIDGNEAVATRETPRGVQYLCEEHAAQMRRMDVKVTKL